jgi:hypothetical protein
VLDRPAASAPVIERLDNPFAELALYPDVTKAGDAESAL